MINTKTLFDNGFFLADGGLETTLIFHHGINLNHFAAFELLNNYEGEKALKNYYLPYFETADKYGLQFILETPTWRANPDWAYKLGYTHEELSAINKKAIGFLRNLANESDIEKPGYVVSGCIGPRGDGYVATNVMTANEAKRYHNDQVRDFALADADIITALTLNYSEEAVGIVKAAKDYKIPVVISFTVETDGKLPNGETLKDAILKVDEQTNAYALHFMINCAHPEHFKNNLSCNDYWLKRIRGVRANASTLSHAELDESETLDTGDACALADNYLELQSLLPNLKVVGGCCGTDHSHMDEICKKLFVDDLQVIS